MKILLIGEYSNVHNTLAEGLRTLGHEVTVISNGDFWKDYPRDIDVERKPGKLGGICLMLKLWALLPRMVGYDVVQLINPIFFELRAEQGGNIFRVFFIFDEGNVVMLFNGFQKKTQKTPEKEINKAIQLKKEYYAEKK